MEELGTIAPVAATPTPIQSFTPTNVGSDDVFESMGAQKPMDLTSLLVFGLFIAFTIYGITYYRKAIATLEQNKKPSDEFTKLNDTVSQIEYNVKRALGKRYSIAA